MSSITQTTKSETEIAARVEEILVKMTLKEKVSLLSGKDSWHTTAIERLGIPSLGMTDGPHGVRSANDGTRRPVSPATSFPTGVSMAASWDPDLIERVGVALAEETRGLGCHILLGPCVNIVRSPLAGRNFEAYSEDPYLAGRIGSAYVKGVQSQNVGTSLKHFACNNQEKDRSRGSSEVDERTLREIYLAQFEMIVKESDPWTVMCSYNRINGTYASENKYLLREILKDEWGYCGVVISDWGAVHNIAEPVNAGLDIEMPGPARYFGGLLEEAVMNWQVEKENVDDAVRRILRMIVRSGALDKENTNPPGAYNTPAHQDLARELAEESVTLLKNENELLPLRKDKIRSIAVIGPNAADARYGGGGSSFLEPPYRISPLKGIQDRAGSIRVGYEEGCRHTVIPPKIKPDFFSYNGKPGLLVEIFNNDNLSGQPAKTQIFHNVEGSWWGVPPAEGVDRNCFSIRWTAKFTPELSGAYTFILGNNHDCTLFINGTQVVENNRGIVTLEQLMDHPETVVAEGKYEVVAGQSYDFKVEFRRKPGDARAVVRLMYQNPSPDGDPIARAVELAQKSDVAIIFAGMPTYYESEGHDRPDMDIPGPQTELIRAVAAANPNTIVVVNAGAPVSMPWAGEVPAILEAYYPGQEGGHAVARVLFGEVNPSGKLPCTFPKRLQDNPAYTNYPGDRTVVYGEGIFVGYRYYDAKDVEPLFPFGFGLSYTTFEYSDLKVASTSKSGEPVEVSLTVKNTGAFAGKEVVQLYVHDEISSLVRPLKELKGFQKVALAPGESKTVTFTLNQRAFSFYHPVKKAWVAEPGDFQILAGSSSRDIRLKSRFNLA